MSSTKDRYHFVTGRLAEHAVRKIVETVAEARGFDYSIDVLPITVAALMTSKWIRRHLTVPPDATKVILPGYLAKHLAEIADEYDVEFVAGPKDIRDLPWFFGAQRDAMAPTDQYRIEILSEINHANRMTIDEVIDQAVRLTEQGANVIDLGCTPGESWSEVGPCVRELRDREIRVSIDSFEAAEVSAACDAGAELVLSVNSSNRDAAIDWNVEVVAIPDLPGDEKSFDETIDFLANAGVSMRLDPILEPIGCGFTDSIQRYAQCRKKYPDATMLMGIGNISELTDVDSAGVNVLLLGICEELGIQSVLTTQVINWARSSTRECDIARRFLHHAVRNRIPPKHLSKELITLRDERVSEFPTESIKELANSIRDLNIRIFSANQEIHAATRDVHVHGADPFDVMRQLLESDAGPSIDPSHAFYLGFEMAKALTALTLDKQYTQDEALDWGHLTREEDHHRLKRKTRKERNGG